MKNFLVKNKILGLLMFLLLMLLGVVTPVIIKGHERGFLSGLTKEQRETIQDKVSELREAGVSHEEIRTEVAKILEGYGIEMPEDFSEKRHVPGRFLSGLNDEQREALRTTITELRKDGATRGEIHAAMTKLLESYGLEIPEDFSKRRRAPGGPLLGLTDEQRKAVRERVTELRKTGATREEIRSNIAEMLEGYGVKLPPRPPGMLHRRGRFPAKLTKEQREEIREKVTEMREDGATREEIRSKMAVMLEDFGIELPRNSGSSSSETPSTTASSDVRILEGYPNSSNSGMNISYILNNRSNVRIQIYDATGRLIRSYEMGVQEPGTYTVNWDGNYGNGAPAASGIYLCRIVAGNQVVSKSMVKLK